MISINLPLIFTVFFKYSAKRIDDYFSTEIVTELDPENMIRHVTTRWLSLQDVLMRIHEQYENLCEYFPKTVPTQAGFKGKNGVGVSERYRRIKKKPTSKKLLAIMSAVINVAQEFTLPM